MKSLFPFALLVMLALHVQAQQNPNDFGDLPGPYPTTLAANGARHVISQSLYLGTASPDGEPDGAPSPNADGDDVNGTDDENAIQPLLLRPVRGFLFYMPVKATNLTGSVATVSGYVDWNNDGDFLDANESSTVTVPAGSAGLTVMMPWTVPTTAVHSTLLAVRLRLSTVGTLPPTGPAPDGEVEDFQIKVLEQGFDYGDLPDSVAGTASGVFGTGSPPDYKTRIADGGPVHQMKPGLYFTNDGTGLMAHLDAETDGQPTANADGDDLGGEDDEYGLLTALLGQVLTMDGTHSTLDLSVLASLAVTNTTGTTAYVYGFMDWNSDGDFDDPGEQSTLAMVPGDGSVTSVNLEFSPRVPIAPSPMNLRIGSRFRISTDTGLGANGMASDGEVHDEVVSFTLSYTPFTPQTVMDYGDLNDARYPTTWLNNGARHVITQTLFMGNVVPDGEADGQSSLAANGDDVNGSNDEDGFLPSSLTLLAGTTVNLPVKCANVTGTAAQLRGFVDWNDDGDFSDAGEQSTALVPDGKNGIVLLPFTVPLTASTTAPVALRLRLSTDTALGPNGRASDGEVEDYLVSVNGNLDYGDLPGAYATKLSDNGARHVPSQALFLGSTMPDTEPDGQPNPTATGDEVHGSNDEDAITPSSLVPVKGFTFHLPVKATNTTGSSATLSAFIDWNGDGDFLDANETLTTAVASGSVNATFTLTWSVPSTAATGTPVGVRLRLATGAALPPVGVALDGEVEDFFITVLAQGLDWGDLPDKNPGTASGVHGTGSPPDYQTRMADGGPSHVLREGLYFADDTTGLLMHLDAEADGQPNTNADGDDTHGEDDENSLFHAITRQTIIPDGIHSEVEVEMMTSLAVTNTTGSTAYVSGFMDVNSDGDFDDPGEQAPVISVPGDGSVTFVTPIFTYRVRNLTGTSKSLTQALRFRISTDTGLGPNGPASDGEVHDELLSYTLNYPAPDPLSMDYGDLTDKDYPTLYAQNGPRHVIKQTIFMGTLMPDGEPDGQPTTTADGDDKSGTDDEDGFNARAVVAEAGMPLTFSVKCSNNNGSAATLYGFVDWNGDGDFQDAGETSSAPVPNGSAAAMIALPWNVPAGVTGTYAAVRLRLSTDSGLGPVGRASDGEVEDYRIVIGQGKDFGDLPDSLSGTAAGLVNNFTTITQGDYRTRLADGGPCHVIRPDLALYNDANPSGVHTDAETDGHPSANADGDDLDVSDDEELLLTALTRQTATNITSTSVDVHYDLFTSLAIKNETGVDAYLTGFLDANNDGDFNDPGETATVTIASSGAITAPGLTFHPVVHLTNRVTSWTVKLPVRFRLSTASGLGPDGPAPDGEVEDYMISINFTVSPWWTTTIVDVPTTPGDGTIDIGTPRQLDPSGDFSTASDIQWSFNNTSLQGAHPQLSASYLQSLGTGRYPYHVSGRHGPRSLRSHCGFFDVKNLGAFRSFMGQHSLSDATASPDADADGDGVSNFAEFVFGTDPGTRNQPAQFDARAINSSGSNYFTLPYLRRTGGTENGARYETADAIYLPEASLDLTTWTQPLTHVSPPSGLPTPPSGYEWGAVRIPTAMGSNARSFIRLTVLPP